MGLLFASTLLLLAPTRSRAQDFVPGEVLVGIDADKDDAKLPPILSATGKSFEHYADLHIHRLKLINGLSVADAVVNLKKIPGVHFAEPNYRAYPCSLPNKPTPPNDSFFGTDRNPYAHKQYAPYLI